MVAMKSPKAFVEHGGLRNKKDLERCSRDRAIEVKAKTLYHAYVGYYDFHFDETTIAIGHRHILYVIQYMQLRRNSALW
jgi:hypothetical protein